MDAEVVAVVGAVVFGNLTGWLGRKKLKPKEGFAAAPEQGRGIGRRSGIDPQALPRPPRAGWAPATVSSLRGEDRDVERELEEIVAALRLHGPMKARELRIALDSRLWGRGRFRSAVNLAQRRGLIREESGKLIAEVNGG